MKKLLLLVCLAVSSLNAQSISLGTASGAPGTTVNLNVTLASAGSQVADLQFDLSYDGTKLTPVATAGSAAVAAGKSVVSSHPSSGVLRVLVVGVNSNAISDGNIVNLAITIGAGAASGSYPLAFSNVSGTDPNANAIAVTSTDGSLTVLPGQTITFNQPATVALGSGPVTLTATSSSNLTVAFASTTPSVCTVAGTTVTLVSAGTCSITATQGGNASFGAATPVTQSFTVTQGSQTISFGTLSNVVFGVSPITISATATSGLAVSFASTTTSVCTVSGTTVTIVGVGTCSITATQAGNANYLAATPVSQSFTVTQASQTITFGTPGNVAFGVSPFTISATVSSGLAVSFASTTTSVCTVSATTVTIVGGGTCSITATQTGNANYAAATPVIQTFTVNPAAQTITFGTPGNAPLGAGTVALTATSTSGLTVAFVSNTTSVCTVSGNVVTLLIYGTCSVTASQAGNASWTAAPPVTQSFSVIAGYVITTVAGSSVSGFGGDGGLAVDASMSYPAGVAVDRAGNLYIADSTNRRIRKVTVSTGVISTVAGNGNCCGSSGDGGPAISAGLSSPSGVAIDSSGNMYIADTGNHRIRKVTVSTGIISTIAGNGTATFSGDGGSATSASLNSPSAVAVDAAGNIYIADTGNNRIRRVDASAGTISTVTGNGTASFAGDGGPAVSASISSPRWITLDSAGDLYIADAGNNRIRKVLAGSGLISTVAGGGCCLVGDGGPATSAYLSNPGGVAVDALGNVFITDSPRVRMVNSSTGNISTVAGTGTTGYNGDGGIATSAALNNPRGLVLDTAGNFYVADLNNQRIRKLSPSQGIFSQTMTFGQIPNAILNGGTVSLSGTATSGLAVSYYSTTAVCQVNGSVVTLVTVGTCSVTAYQVGDNNYAPAIPVTQSFSITLPGQTITFGPLSNIVLGSGLVTLTATATSGLAVGFLSATQTVCTVSGNIVTLLTSGACSITSYQTGNASYAAASPVTQLFTVTPASQTITFGVPPNVALVLGTVSVTASATSGLPASFSSTTPSVCAVNGITINLLSVGLCSITASQAGNANYLAAIPVTQSFSVLTGAAQTITFNPLSSVGLVGGSLVLSASATSGLPVTFSSGSPAICAVSANTVTLLAVGTCTVTASQSGNATWAAAVPVTRSSAVASASLNAVSYTISTAAGNDNLGYSGDGGPATAQSLYNPGGVALDSSGNLYIADTGNYRVRKVMASTGSISTVAGTGIAAYTGDGGPATSAGLINPASVAVDPSGNIHLTDSYRTREVTSSGGIILTTAGSGNSGFSGDGGPAISAALNANGIAVDVAGNIYIADSSSSRIRMVSASTGIISTIAGNGTSAYSGDGGLATAASLKGPSGVALDLFGNLYIADPGNGRIRMVNLSTGIISTVAGNGFEGFSGDGGPATGATLFQPKGVAVDLLGNIYIADSFNNRIRRVTAATGAISTIAGNAIGAFSGDGGSATLASLSSPDSVAVDAYGNVYVADTGNNRVRLLSPVMGTTPQTINFASLSNLALTVGTVTLTATASSGLPVTFSPATPSVCAVSGSVVTLLAAGNCSIVAAQSGNAAYAPAPPVTQSFTVNAGTQVITFVSLANAVFGSGPVILSAAASSGLAVTFSSATQNVCTVSGNTVSLVGVGTCSIVATQSGDADFYAASPVTRSFSVAAPPNSATLSAGIGVGTAGRTVELPIQLLSSDLAAPASFQLDLNFDSSKLTFASARIGAQSTAAGKTLSMATPQGGAVRLLVSGVNQTTIANGVAAWVSFTLSSQFTSGSTPVATSNCSAVDASGSALLTPCVAGQIRYASCDINGDGVTNVSDVQLIINEALGVIPAIDDLNGDGAVTVADLQIVINAALGLGCNLP